MTTIATHDHPEATGQALQARALLSRCAVVQVALQKRVASFGPQLYICCGDPECQERHLWNIHKVMAEAEHTEEQYDLSRQAWKIANRECLLRQAERGMRTWANAAEHIKHLNIEELP